VERAIGCLIRTWLGHLHHRHGWLVAKLHRLHWQEVWINEAHRLHWLLLLLHRWRCFVQSLLLLARRQTGHLANELDRVGESQLRKLGRLREHRVLRIFVPERLKVLAEKLRLLLAGQIDLPLIEDPLIRQLGLVLTYLIAVVRVLEEHLQNLVVVLLAVVAVCDRANVPHEWVHTRDDCLLFFR